MHFPAQYGDMVCVKSTEPNYCILKHEDDSLKECYGFTIGRFVAEAVHYNDDEPGHRFNVGWVRGEDVRDTDTVIDEDEYHQLVPEVQAHNTALPKEFIQPRERDAIKVRYDNATPEEKQQIIAERFKLI